MIFRRVFERYGAECVVKYYKVQLAIGCAVQRSITAVCKVQGARDWECKFNCS